MLSFILLMLLTFAYFSISISLSGYYINSSSCATQQVNTLIVWCTQNFNEWKAESSQEVEPNKINFYKREHNLCISTFYHHNNKLRKREKKSLERLQECFWKSLPDQARTLRFFLFFFLMIKMKTFKPDGFDLWSVVIWSCESSLWECFGFFMGRWFWVVLESSRWCCDVDAVRRIRWLSYLTMIT